jgi:hypothetical protein
MIFFFMVGLLSAHEKRSALVFTSELAGGGFTAELEGFLSHFFAAAGDFGGGDLRF